MNDPEEFLNLRIRTVPDAALQQRLRGETTRVLRRRRRAKQVGYGAALVLCYAAGLATMRLWIPKLPVAVPLEIVESAPVPAAVQVVASVPLENDPDVPAVVIERVAAAAHADRRAQLYHRAGDRYLENDNDLSSALRCYSLALDYTTESDLAIMPDDNWLLMNLKKARQEEKRHAQANS
jgi:hypothetical protein